MNKKISTNIFKELYVANVVDVGSDYDCRPRTLAICNSKQEAYDVIKEDIDLFKHEQPDGIVKADYDKLVITWHDNHQTVYHIQGSTEFND